MKGNEQEERGFKGIWIPKEVWENKDLTLMEKISLVEIESYDKKFGCVASNATLSKNLEIKPNTFGNIVRSLESKGFIKTSYDDMNCYSGRVIKVVKEKYFGIELTPLENQEPPLENQEPPLENQEPPLENQEHSNTFSNTFSKCIKPEKISGDMSDSEKAEYYVSKFNSMVVINGIERKFKSSNAIKSSLKARIKDGYTLKDILKAIKCAMRDEFHFKTKYKHLTPQFFLRQDKLDKFLNAADNEEIIEENKKEIYENPYDQYGATN